MTYRLGIDIGTNSLGWCLLELNAAGEPCAVLDIGVRVFPDSRDPQSGASLAVDRRLARSMRRRRDRYLLRRADLMAALVRHELMPREEKERKKLEGLDPYRLRAIALVGALPPHHLGRALFHLNQRRGFKSNRKTDTGGDGGKEAGKVKAGGDNLALLMDAEGARTIGEFLYNRRKRRKPVRTRMVGAGAKASYDFYPQRAMLEAEFDAIWQVQAAHNGDLTQEMRDDIRSILFRQRPLKPVDVGKCALDPAESKENVDGYRAPWAMPLAQKFRIYQELNNLRVVRPDHSERRLDQNERDAIAALLLAKGKKTVSFKAMRKMVVMDADDRFNLESEKRKDLKGDLTAYMLAKKELFGAVWYELDEGRQTEIVERLLEEENEEALVSWLAKDCGLRKEAALKTANARMPDGHCRLGLRALAKMVPIMEDQGLDYAAAADEAGYHHSDHRPEDILDELPYYGEALQRHVSGSSDPDDSPEDRYGRITNPTVHVGLNQMRKLINALIKAHGHPKEIVVELARDLKLSQKDKDRIEKEQTDNQKLNDKRRGKLIGLNEKDNGENRMKLRLWEELNPDDPLDRRCVYTGEKISLQRLFSAEVEIEHILPFSRTLDNSAANKTVSMRRANREKGNSSPHEAFSHDAKRWGDILERAGSLPKNKLWRFGPDAMQRFEAEEKGFLDRQLTDTAYLAKATREYLTHVCDSKRVWAVPGRLTAMLRGKWGLNGLLSDANLKNRSDHRHHAIDAVVAAVTDRGLLQRVATAAGESRERLIDDMPEPWDGFRDDLRDALLSIAVSHKPDHGKGGKLHEETAYGLINDPDKEDGHNLVYRKALMGLNENEIERIRDKALRGQVRDYVYEAAGAGKDIKEALAMFSADSGVRRVRLLKKEAGMIEIADANRKAYKAYSPGDNHCIEIFELPDGKWKGEAITVFQANSKAHVSKWRREYPKARLVMRVHKGDLLKLDHGGEEEIMRVVRLEISSQRLRLAGHRESGDFEKRHKDPDDFFRWFFASFSKMPNYRARKVSVDIMGRVQDPGFKA